MSEWKVFKVYQVWKFEFIYMVGRKINEEGPVEMDNIEWDGFYSQNQNECISFAEELNRRNHGQDK